MTVIPEHLRALFQSVKEVIDSGQSEQFQALRQKLLEEPKAADFPLYHYLLARIAKELGDRELAVTHLAASLEQDPDNVLACLLVAEHNLRNNNSESALHLAKHASTLEIESSEHACRIFRLLLRLDAIEIAEEFITSAVSANPNDYNLIACKAELYDSKGDFGNFKDLILEASNLAPSSEVFKLKYRLSIELMLREEFVEPIEHLELALSGLNVTINHQPINSLYLLLALCYFSIGETDQGRAKLIEVTERNNPLSHYCWAYFHFLVQDNQSSIQSLIALKASLGRSSVNVFKEGLASQSSKIMLLDILESEAPILDIKSIKAILPLVLKHIKSR